MIRQTDTLEADYVIVGAGAAGMAFADEMLSAGDCDMIIVDRRHRPGGHWNDGYPFVRLHGASSLYGVNSRPLGEGPRDRSGPNAGLGPLPSGGEICAYYDEVMRQRLLPSGRVTYLPMCEYADGGAVTSRLSGRRFEVRARRKSVDATYSDTKVPATHPPTYAVAPGMTCIAPNALPAIAEAPAGYTIIGGGKTAMDSVVWLLEQGVAPERIAWIRPRDSWVVDRAARQFGPDSIAETVTSLASEIEIAADAGDFPEMFERLEAANVLMRIDPQVCPSSYRCATLSRAELAELRRITNVIRLGRVERIDRDEIVLQNGTVPTGPDQVHVDCTAPGLTARPPRPVFEDGRITLQMVRTCQPSFSGAIIARIEAMLDEDGEKNAMSVPTPPPYQDKDWARMLVANAHNQRQWSGHPDLSAWIAESRLDGTAGISPVDRQGEDALAAARQRLRENIGPAVANLNRLLSRLDRPAGDSSGAANREALSADQDR